MVVLADPCIVLLRLIPGVGKTPSQIHLCESEDRNRTP
jgi:hypothetical protein